MFDTKTASVELLAGEADVSSGWADDVDRLADLVTVDEVASGWVEEDRHVLPDLDSIPPGPFLFMLLGAVDRAKLNGFDLVEVLKARERMISQCQAGCCGRCL
jgi:hypothetical protein